MGKLAKKFQTILEKYEARMKQGEYGRASHEFNRSIVPFMDAFEKFEPSDGSEQDLHQRISNLISNGHSIIRSSDSSISTKLEVIETHFRPALHGLNALGI